MLRVQIIEKKIACASESCGECWNIKECKQLTESETEWFKSLLLGAFDITDALKGGEKVGNSA